MIFSVSHTELVANSGGAIWSVCCQRFRTLKGSPSGRGTSPRTTPRATHTLATLGPCQPAVALHHEGVPLVDVVAGRLGLAESDEATHLAVVTVVRDGAEQRAGRAEHDGHKTCRQHCSVGEPQSLSGVDSDAAPTPAMSCRIRC